jgi:hypothetical protein
MYMNLAPALGLDFMSAWWAASWSSLTPLSEAKRLKMCRVSKNHSRVTLAYN